MQKFLADAEIKLQLSLASSLTQWKSKWLKSDEVVVRNSIFICQVRAFRESIKQIKLQLGILTIQTAVMATRTTKTNNYFICIFQIILRKSVIVTFDEKRLLIGSSNDDIHASWMRRRKL